MSTEYTPFLGVGLTFERMQGVADFLSGYDLLEGVDIVNDDLEDIAKHCGVRIEYFGIYDCFFVGYVVESDTVLGLSALLVTSLDRWNNRFLAHEPELVHLVNTF